MTRVGFEEGLEARAGIELEPLCGRERVAAGDEWEPAGEMLSRRRRIPKHHSLGGEFGGAGRNRTGDRGFADLGLTTWLPRHGKNPRPGRGLETLERETGFEPATSTLARSHSTAELLPLGSFDYK